MRLSISVPDSLNERLAPFKESLNISEICRMALEETVAIKEIGASPNILDRRREELSQFVKDYFAAGKTEGIKDYEELELTDVIKVDVLHENNAPWQSMLELLTVGWDWDMDSIFESQGVAGNVAKKAWITGWVEGVLSVWHQHKKLLLEE